MAIYIVTFETRVFIGVAKVPLAFTFERFSSPFRTTANILSKTRNREGTQSVRHEKRRREGVKEEIFRSNAKPSANFQPRVISSGYVVKRLVIRIRTHREFCVYAEIPSHVPHRLRDIGRPGYERQ